MSDRIQELEAQFREAGREVAMRRKLYPKWVAKGTLDSAQADRQIALMEGIKETVRQALQAEKMRGMSGSLIE